MTYVISLFYLISDAISAAFYRGRRSVTVRIYPHATKTSRRV
jgi:hypothetical protein